MRRVMNISMNTVYGQLRTYVCCRLVGFHFCKFCGRIGRKRSHFAPCVLFEVIFFSFCGTVAGRSAFQQSKLSLMLRISNILKQAIHVHAVGREEKSERKGKKSSGSRGLQVSACEWLSASLPGGGLRALLLCKTNHQGCWDE